MGKIRNMGSATMKFGEGIIVSGSVAENTYALYTSGSVIFNGQLHISGSDQEGLRIAKGPNDYKQIVFETDGVDSANIHLSNAENLVIMNETSGQDIQFWVDSAAGGDIQAITIKETGKVGVGSTAPDTTLHVYANVSNEYVATIDNDQNSSGHVLKLATDGNGSNSYLLEMESRLGGTETAVFKARADGRFGFGPDGVTSMGAGTFVVGIGNSSHTADIAISQRLQHMGDSNTYMDFPSNDNITFAAGGSEELKIASDAVLVKQYIKHDGDENTLINFVDDGMTLKAGGISFINLDQKASAPHELTFNDGSNNIDFIVKGNGSNAGNPGFFFDASNNRVGINGVGSPDYELDVAGNIGLNEYIYHNGDDNTYIRFQDDDINIQAGGVDFIKITEDDTQDKIVFNDGNSDVDFIVKSNGVDKAIYINSGNGVLHINHNDENFKTKIHNQHGETITVHQNGIVINDDGHATNDFRVESDSQTHMLFVDSGDNKIGVGTSSPISELDVAGKIAITAEMSTPSQPADGKGYLYTKSDGKIYWRSHDITETDLTAGGGGGSTNAAGSDGQIQYNNGGTNFGGAAQLYYDDSNNRLGIGISSPNQALHLQDGIALLQWNNNNEFSSEIQFTKSRNATDGAHTVVQADDILGEIVFKGSDGDEFVTAAAITAKVGFVSPSNNDMPGRIVFSTTADGANSLTEAMKITQGQGVVVPNGALAVLGTNSGAEITDTDGSTNGFAGIFMDYFPTAYNSKDGGRLIVRGDSSNNDRGTFVIKLEKFNTTSGLEPLQIDSSGNVKVTGGSVGSVSDSRVKENVSTISSALEKVKLLNPVEFDWKDPIKNHDPARTSNHDFGFLAQEIESIYPDVIYTGPETNDDMPDNLKTMSYTSLIPILTKAIQEQQEKIEALEARINTLEG